MQKKTKKTPVKQKKKAQSPKKKNDQPFSLKRLIMGEEKPDLTELEAGSTTILDILSPTTIDTKSRDYIVVDGIFHAYLYVAGYGYSTTVGSCWLAPLVEAGEGVNLSFIFKRQPKEKILSKIAQTTMVNRSRMRDVGDTRQDFEELDSAISSGLYLKDAINRQGEDFYYMHTLIEVTAEDAETLEQRVTAVEKLCVSIDMIARRCDYKNEQAFLSMLPLLALDPDVERQSRRNALLQGLPQHHGHPEKIPGQLRRSAGHGRPGRFGAARYVTGSASAMGQRNDIDLDNKYIVLDTSGMPDDLLLPGIFWATDVANDLIMDAGGDLSALIADEL